MHRQSKVDKIESFRLLHSKTEVYSSAGVSDYVGHMHQGQVIYVQKTAGYIRAKRVSPFFP